MWGCLATTLLLHLFNPVAEIDFLNIGGTVNYLFYFLLGYLVRRKNLTRSIVHRPTLFLLFTFPLSVVLLLLDFRGQDVLCAVNGIALSFALGALYFRIGCRWLHPMFGASYTIYLYSWFPQVVSQQVFLVLTGAPWWIGGLLAFITGLLIPLGIHRWITGHQESRLGKIAAFVSGM